MPKASKKAPTVTIATVEPAETALPGMPTSLKAFTTLKVPKGWAFVELTLDRDLNVTDCQVTQPDVKAIITEKFKIAVGKYWSKQEG